MPLSAVLRAIGRSAKIQALNRSQGKSLSDVSLQKAWPALVSKIGSRVGRLADEDMLRLNRAVLVFLGIAAPAGDE